MDKFERLLKERKQKTQKAAHRVTQLAGEGIRSAKDAMEELDKKKIARQLTNPLPGGMQAELLKRDLRKLDEKYEKNRERLIRYKCREVTNEYHSKKDMAIHSAYFRSGGIRFHIVTLLDHIKLLDPEHDDVNNMIISCYNSAIYWMMLDVDELKEKYDALTRELEGVKEMFWNDATLKKSIGYTDCTEQVKALKSASGDDLAKLRAAVESNDKALKDYLRRCEKGLSYRPINNIELLEDLNKLLSPEVTDKFAAPEGWDPESYYAAVTRFGNELKTELLEKYKVSED